LRERLTGPKRNQADVDDELDRGKDSAKVSSPRAVDAFGDVAVGANWIAVRVELDEEVPKHRAGPGGGNKHEEVEQDAWNESAAARGRYS